MVVLNSRDQQGKLWILKKHAQKQPCNNNLSNPKNVSKLHDFENFVNSEIFVCQPASVQKQTYCLNCYVYILSPFFLRENVISVRSNLCCSDVDSFAVQFIFNFFSSTDVNFLEHHMI